MNASGRCTWRPAGGRRRARFNRWIDAAPAQDIDVTTTPCGDDWYTVDLGDFASGQVELGSCYPTDVPPRWRHDPVDEQPPKLTAHTLYAERWLFHGPRFQAITELLVIGDRHARAILTTPEAPGGLLDAVGQVIAVWMMHTERERWVVFPVAMERIRFFGRQPAPGARLECVVRIRSLTDSHVVADAQLIAGDATVWAQIDSWVDRRFDSDDRTVASIPVPGA